MLQENLRKYHQEQRVLMDKVNLLQQQLTQVYNATLEDFKICPLKPSKHACSSESRWSANE